jgi:hypothetical protein
MIDLPLDQLAAPAAVTGTAMAVGGAAWWFKRWTASVDQSLRDIAEVLRRLSTKTAVNEARLTDIEKIRDRSIITEQKALAAHRRLDELSNH